MGVAPGYPDRPAPARREPLRSFASTAASCQRNGPNLGARCEISTSVADSTMRSALSACLRKNLVSFTIGRPRQTVLPPAHGGTGCLC
jgi:hypothetical protein